MTTIIDFNDRLKIEEAASMWIAKIDRKLSAAEEMEFKMWVTFKAAHYKIFMSMAAHWDRTESLRKFHFQKHQAEVIATKKNAYQPYMAAACFLLVIILSFITYQQFPNATDDAYRISYLQEFSTTTKSASEFQLPDGSQLKLNVRSRVSVSYSAKIRRIELMEGELYVDVAHDVSRPLVVLVNDRFIKAVGTAFNVEALSGKNVELTVTEGKVIFGSLDAAGPVANQSFVKGTALSKGQQAILGGVTDIVVTKSADEINRVLAWKKGALVFNEQTLREVLDEMQRYNDYEFTLNTVDMETIKVTGHFNANNIEEFLAAMEDNFGIHHKIEPGHKIILFEQ
jgi:transmembrane sensor